MQAVQSHDNAWSLLHSNGSPFIMRLMHGIHIDFNSGASLRWGIVLKIDVGKKKEKRKKLLKVRGKFVCFNFVETATYLSLYARAHFCSRSASYSSAYTCYGT